MASVDLNLVYGEALEYEDGTPFVHNPRHPHYRYAGVSYVVGGRTSGGTRMFRCSDGREYGVDMPRYLRRPGPETIEEWRL